MQNNKHEQSEQNSTTTSASNVKQELNFFINFDKEEYGSLFYNDSDASLATVRLALLVSLGQGYYEGEKSATILKYLSDLKKQHRKISIDIVIADTLQVFNALDPWQLSKNDKNVGEWWLRGPAKVWSIEEVKEKDDIKDEKLGSIRVYRENTTLEYHGCFGDYSFINSCDTPQGNPRKFNGTMQYDAEGDLIEKILLNVARQAGERWEQRHETVAGGLPFIYWKNDATNEDKSYIDGLFKNDPAFRLLVLRKIAQYKRSKIKSGAEGRFWQMVLEQIKKIYENSEKNRLSIEDLRREANKFFDRDDNDDITQVMKILDNQDNQNENYFTYIKKYILSETAVLMGTWSKRYSHIFYLGQEPLFEYLSNLHKHEASSNRNAPPQWVSYSVEIDQFASYMKNKIDMLDIKGLQKVKYVPAAIMPHAKTAVESWCFYKADTKPEMAVADGCVVLWKANKNDAVSSRTSSSRTAEWHVQYGTKCKPLKGNDELLAVLEQVPWGTEVQRQLRQVMAKMSPEVKHFTINDQIIQNWFSKGACRYLLMSGDSGSGKSSWSKNFAKTCWQQQIFPLVFWCDARKLFTPLTPAKNEEGQQVFHYLKHHVCPPGHVFYYYQQVKRKPSLFVLDNYHGQLPEKTEESARMQEFIHSIQQLPHANLIVTTTQSSNIPVNGCTRVMLPDNIVTMEGFNQVGIRKYVDQSFVGPDHEKEAQACFDRIQQDSYLHTFTRQPLFLSILVHLWQQGTDVCFSKISITQLFNELFKQTFKEVIEAVTFKFVKADTNPNQTYYYVTQNKKYGLVSNPTGKLKKKGKKEKWQKELKELEKGESAIQTISKLECTALSLVFNATKHEEEGHWSFEIPGGIAEKYMLELNERLRGDTRNKENELDYFKQCIEVCQKDMLNPKDMLNRKLPSDVYQHLLEKFCLSLAKCLYPNQGLEPVIPFTNNGLGSVVLDKLRFAIPTQDGYTLHEIIRHYLLAQLINKSEENLQPILNSPCFSLDEIVTLWQFTLGLMAQRTTQTDFNRLLKTCENLWEKCQQTEKSLYHLVLCQEQIFANVPITIDVEKIEQEFFQFYQSRLDNKYRDLLLTLALNQASKAGSMGCVGILLKLGANVDGIFHHNDLEQAINDGKTTFKYLNLVTYLTPLQHAVIGNHTSSVQLLLDNHAGHSVSYSPTQAEPFFEACEQGQLAIIQIFLTHCIKESQVLDLYSYDADRGGCRAFIYTSRSGHVEVLEELIKKLEDLGMSSAVINTLLLPKQYPGYLLKHAISNGHIPMLKYLIQQLRKTGSDNSEINCALRQVYFNNDAEEMRSIFPHYDNLMLRYVINEFKNTGSSYAEMGAAFSQMDKQGFSKLEGWVKHLCCNVKNVDHYSIIKNLHSLLKAMGKSSDEIYQIANQSSPDVWLALILAGDHEDILRDLMGKDSIESINTKRQGHSILDPMEDYLVLLHWASAKGFTSLLEDLLSELKQKLTQSEINRILHQLFTRVKYHAHIPTLQFLVKNLKETGSEDQEIREMFCQKGFDGMTLVILAAFTGNQSLLEYLIGELVAANSSLPEINKILQQESFTGWTPLLVAINDLNINILEKLVLQLMETGSSYADIYAAFYNKRGPKGMTVMSVAQSRGGADLVEYLDKFLQKVQQLEQQKIQQMEQQKDFFQLLSELGEKLQVLETTPKGMTAMSVLQSREGADLVECLDTFLQKVQHLEQQKDFLQFLSESRKKLQVLETINDQQAEMERESEIVANNSSATLTLIANSPFAIFTSARDKVGATPVPSLFEQRILNELKVNLNKIIKVETIPFSYGKLYENLHDLCGWYNGDYVTLQLMLQASGEATIQSRSAITSKQVSEVWPPIENSSKQYGIFALNTAYENAKAEVKNHWVLIVIGKQEKCVYYLDPAIKPIDERFRSAYINSPFKDYRLVVNPIDFQQKEKQQQIIRHSGVYVVEIFAKLSQEIKAGKLLPGCHLSDEVRQDALISLLNTIPYGEGEITDKLRICQAKQAYRYLWNSHVKGNFLGNYDNWGMFGNNVKYKAEALRDIAARIDKKTFKALGCVNQGYHLLQQEVEEEYTKRFLSN